MRLSDTAEGSSVPPPQALPPPPPPPVTTLQRSLNEAKSQLSQEQSQYDQDTQFLHLAQSWLSNAQHPFNALSDALTQGPPLGVDQIREAIRATQAKIAAEGKKVAADQQAVANAQTHLEAMSPPPRASDPSAGLIRSLQGSVSQDQANVRIDAGNVQDLTGKLSADQTTPSESHDDPVLDMTLHQYAQQLQLWKTKLTQDQKKLAQDQASLQAAQTGQKAAQEYPSSAKAPPLSNKVTQAADAAQSQANGQVRAAWEVSDTQARLDAQSHQVDALKKQLQAHPNDPKVLQELTAATTRQVSLKGKYEQALSYAGELSQQAALSKDQSAVARDQTALGTAQGQYQKSGSAQSAHQWQAAQTQLFADQQQQQRDQQQLGVDQAGLVSASEAVAFAPQIGVMSADQDRADALSGQHTQLINSGQGCTVQGVSVQQTQQQAQAALKQQQSTPGWTVYQTLDSNANTEAERVAVWEGQQIQIGVPGAAADVSAVVQGVTAPGSHANAWELSVSDSQEPAGNVPELTRAAAGAAVQQGQFELSLSTSDYWQSVFDLSLPANLQNPQSSQDVQAQDDAWDEFVSAHGLTQLTDRDVAAQLESLGPDGKVDATAGLNEIQGYLGQQQEISASRSWSERAWDRLSGSDPEAGTSATVQQAQTQLQQLIAQKSQLTPLQFNQRYENIMGTLGPQFDSMAASERAATSSWDQAQTAVVTVVASGAAVTFGGFAGMGMFLLYTQESKALDNVVTLQAGGKVADDSGVSLLTAVTNNFGQGGDSWQELGNATEGFGTDALDGVGAVAGGRFGSWLAGKVGTQWVPVTLTKWGVQGLKSAPEGAGVDGVNAVVSSNMGQSGLVRIAVRGANLTGFQAVAGTGQVTATAGNALYEVGTHQQTAAQAWGQVKQAAQATAFDTVMAPFVGGLGGAGTGRLAQIGSDVLTNTALTTGYDYLTGHVSVSDWIVLALNTAQGSAPHLRREARPTDEALGETAPALSSPPVEGAQRPPAKQGISKSTVAAIGVAVATPVAMRLGMHPSQLHGLLQHGGVSAMAVGGLPLLGRMRGKSGGTREARQGRIPEVRRDLAAASGDSPAATSVPPKTVAGDEYTQLRNLLQQFSQPDDPEFTASLLSETATLTPDERQRVLDNGHGLPVDPADASYQQFKSFLESPPTHYDASLKARRAAFALWFTGTARQDVIGTLTKLEGFEQATRTTTTGPALSISQRIEQVRLRKQLVDVSKANDVPTRLAGFGVHSLPTSSVEAQTEAMPLGGVRHFSPMSDYRTAARTVAERIKAASSGGKPLNLVIETGAPARDAAGVLRPTQYGTVGAALLASDLLSALRSQGVSINVTVVADSMSVPVVRATNAAVRVEGVTLVPTPGRAERVQLLRDLAPDVVISLGKSDKEAAYTLVRLAQGENPDVVTIAVADGTADNSLNAVRTADHPLFAWNPNLGAQAFGGLILKDLGHGEYMHTPGQVRAAYTAAGQAGAIRDDARFVSGAAPDTLDIDAHVGTWYLLNSALAPKAEAPVEAPRPSTWRDAFTADYNVSRSNSSLQTYNELFKRALPAGRPRDRLATQLFQLSQANRWERIRTGAAAFLSLGGAGVMYATFGTSDPAARDLAIAIAAAATSVRQVQILKITGLNRLVPILLKPPAAGESIRTIPRSGSFIGPLNRLAIEHASNDPIAVATRNRRLLKSIRTRFFTYTTTFANTIWLATEAPFSVHGASLQFTRGADASLALGLVIAQVAYGRRILSARLMPDGKLYAGEMADPTTQWGKKIVEASESAVLHVAPVLFGFGSGTGLFVSYGLGNADPATAVNIASEARSLGNVGQGAGVMVEWVVKRKEAKEAAKVQQAGLPTRLISRLGQAPYSLYDLVVTYFGAGGIIDGAIVGEKSMAEKGAHLIHEGIDQLGHDV
jgi:hypothetical protein